VQIQYVCPDTLPRLISVSLGTQVEGADMKISLVVFLFVLCCHVADATELSGSWRLKYSEAGGRKHFVAKGITITLTIRDSTWTVAVAGVAFGFPATPSHPNGSGWRARFATNDTKLPKEIDLYGTSETPGTAWKGIYEIEGNTLRVCRTRLMSRPTRFFSSRDASVFIEVYELISS
jgi:uncharacterized protein (TIGR03067 family)